MKRNKFEQFCDNIPDDRMHQIIEDYERFTTQGHIGTCVMRTCAELWQEEIGCHLSVTQSMKDLTLEALKRFYKHYQEMRLNK